MEYITIPYERGLAHFPVLERIKSGAPEGAAIIAATPIIKQPETVPYRVIVVYNRLDEGTPLVVWHQHFTYEPVVGVPGATVLKHESFNDGCYFGLLHLVSTLEVFADRAKRMAGYSRSIGNPTDK